MLCLCCLYQTLWFFPSGSQRLYAVGRGRQHDQPLMKTLGLEYPVGFLSRLAQLLAGGMASPEVLCDFTGEDGGSLSLVSSRISLDASVAARFPLPRLALFPFVVLHLRCELSSDLEPLPSDALKLRVVLETTSILAILFSCFHSSLDLYSTSYVSIFLNQNPSLPLWLLCFQKNSRFF